jgi:cold shock CspA family protein
MEPTTTRFNGTLKKWNAQRGFGFVVAEQGGQELFVHVSALPRDGWIPVIGEPLTFEIELDQKDGRKRAVRVRRPGVPVAAATAAKVSRAEQARHQARRASPSAGSSSSFGTRAIALLLVAGLGWYAYAQYTERVNEALRADAAADAAADVAVPQSVMGSPQPPETKPQVQQSPPSTPRPPTPAAARSQIQQQPASFHCDGRRYCSQMTSCREAKLFLKNCPGMKMDGNGDGVPCEQQWCTGLFGG